MTAGRPCMRGIAPRLLRNGDLRRGPCTVPCGEGTGRLRHRIDLSHLLTGGHGMAFVGRQVRFTVHGDELLFHVDQLRYVVVELKIGQFEPAHVGQLGTYVALVDDRLGKPDRHAQPSASSSSPAATKPSSATPSPAHPRRSQSPTTPTTVCPPTSRPHSPVPRSSPPSSNATPARTTLTGRNGPYRRQTGDGRTATRRGEHP